VVSLAASEAVVEAWRPVAEAAAHQLTKDEYAQRFSPPTAKFSPEEMSCESSSNSASISLALTSNASSSKTNLTRAVCTRKRIPSRRVREPTSHGTKSTARPNERKTAASL